VTAQAAAGADETSAVSVEWGSTSEPYVCSVPISFYY
jgi:hypothetical protein